MCLPPNGIFFSNSQVMCDYGKETDTIFQNNKEIKWEPFKRAEV